MGGRLEALQRLTGVFYAKVPGDPVLSPVFAHMGDDHARHVAAFIAEVFGGPTAWSIPCFDDRAPPEPAPDRDPAPALDRPHADSLDEAGLPDDPEFRAAVVGYLEWGTRLAVINSVDGVPEPSPDMPMPTWNWEPPGGPWLG